MNLAIRPGHARNGNAVHFHDVPTLIDDIVGVLPPMARVLDFGGGTGNLSLALAAHDPDRFIDALGIDAHLLTPVLYRR